MQLSQLENAVFTSLAWLVMSVKASRLTTVADKLSANAPQSPPRRLLTIATSMDGIFTARLPFPGAEDVIEGCREGERREKRPTKR